MIYPQMAGRPRKSPMDRRADTFRLRMTSEERALIDDAADRVGLSVSAWARMTLLQEARKTRPTEVDKAATSSKSGGAIT